MKIAILRCCVTPIFLKQYESSTNAVLKEIGIEFVDIKEFNCCGYPLKNINFKAHVLSSVRNLSLAEKHNLNIMTFCNCCYVTTKNVNHLMKDEPSIRHEMNEILAKEGLNYQGSVEVKHLLDVLHTDIGIEQLKVKIKRTFKGLKIATHYGCHFMHPRKVLEDKNHTSLLIFDKLVKITGAESVVWQNQHECCGAPVWGTNDLLSMDLTEKKVLNARQSGADYLCSACAFCQLQFDRVQKMYTQGQSPNHHIPSILFTQLIGLSLGIDKDVLGIDKNELDIRGILNYLS